ncbi:MAG: hypothetical protein COA58_16815 [Bacteroidetes bacterium]|nr:MAG: hypothetical protein COA58_16815 [Bacteroidota bacterium]
MRRNFFILMLLISLQGFTQVNLDSMWSVWNDPDKPDSSRLNAIENIARDYLYRTPDSSIYCARLQYNFAKRKGLKKGMAGALKMHGTYFYFQSSYDKAIDYYKRSLTLYEEIEFTLGVAQLLNNIGTVYYQMDDYSNALDFFNRSLTIKKEKGRKLDIGKALNNIGTVYMDQGNYAEAISYLIRALTILEEIEDRSSLAPVLNNIGLVYEELDDYDKAIDYYKRELSIEKEMNNQLGISVSLGNLGNAYGARGDYDRAINYITQSLTICNEIGYDHGKAEALVNLGSNFENKNDNIAAIDYYTRGLEIMEKIGDKSGTSNTLDMIASFYNKSGDYNKAITNGNRSLSIAREIGNLVGIERAANVLYESYKATNKNMLALRMYELYVASRDSLESEENKIALVRQEYKYTYDKKAHADSVLFEAILTINKAELQRTKTQQYALFWSLTLVLAFLAFGYNRFLVTRKQKRVIEGQNKKINVAVENLISTQSQLVQQTILREKLMGMITHDVMGSLKLMNNVGEELVLTSNEPEERNLRIAVLSESSSEIYSVMKNILQWVKIQKHELKVQTQKVNLHSLVSEIILSLRFNKSFNKFTISNKILEHLIIKSDYQMLRSVFYNLMENQIKHNDRGDITIVAKDNGEHYQIKIINKNNTLDNMIIVNQNLSSKLDSIPTMLSLKGGLGMIIVKDLLLKMGGNIQVEVYKASGHAIVLELPKLNN